MEDLTGKQFGRYQIVAPLGEGGMAAVYKAYQPAMERHVAVKVLPRHMASSEEFVARFEREAKLLAQLQHPHILPVFDYGESEGYTYIVMPFVQSGTLADLMKKGQLGMHEIRRIMTQIGDALAYAHTRGMIHRDIKPSNVLIDERGNCLLTDFGLARMAEASAKLTSSGAIMGTPAYMAPEQGSGSSIDHRSDLYALGVIFYELVTGRVPYTAETPIAIVFKHISDPLPSARKINPDLDEEIELAIFKALAKNPDDRYQSAEEFVRAIQFAIPEKQADRTSKKSNQDKTEITPPPSQAPTVMPVPQPRAETVATSTSAALKKPVAVPMWLVGLVGVIVVGVIAFFMLGNKQSDSKTSASPTEVEPTQLVTVGSTQPPPPPQGTSFEIIPGSMFTDNFDGKLSDGWNWNAEDPARWSLSEAPGFLQIIASDASLDGPTSVPNILFRYSGAENFEATTVLRFRPNINFQFAGFILFQDGNNALQFGRAFCDDPDQCVGDGLYFDSVTDSVFALNNFRTPIKGDIVHLRLRRAGNLYIAFYSMDGTNWIELGRHEREFTTVNVGLIAAQSPRPIPAHFDFLTLNEFPTLMAKGPLACLEQPITDSTIAYQFQKDESTPLVARSKDGRWLSVQHPKDVNAICWIPLDGNITPPNIGALPRVDTTPTEPPVIPASTVARPVTGATVTGYVFWGTHPIANATVQIKEIGDFYSLPVLAETTTDENGLFIINDAPVGHLYIYAVAPPGPEFWAWSGHDINTAGNTTVNAGTLHLAKKLKLLEPFDKSIHKDGLLTFVWEAFPEAVKYHLDIFNNKTGEAVFRSDLNDIKFTLPKPLPPGDYQWSVDAFDAAGNTIAYYSPFFFQIVP